jgi:hypothetical protein
VKTGFIGTCFILLMTVRPSVASVTVAPSHIQFADQQVGTRSASRLITLNYTSPDMPPAQVFAYLDSPDFHIAYGASDLITATMNCGAQGNAFSCTVPVVFQPSGRGSLAATLVISNAPPFRGSIIASVNLAGVGIGGPDSLAGFQKFEAFGTAVWNSPDSCPGFEATDKESPVMFKGTLKGDLIGTGTYQICTWTPQGNPTNGHSYLLFTSACEITNDCLNQPGSSFRLALNVLAYSPFRDGAFSGGTISGTYILEPGQSTGGFQNQLVRGSGLFEIGASASDRITIVLNGAVVTNN